MSPRRSHLAIKISIESAPRPSFIKSRFHIVSSEFDSLDWLTATWAVYLRYHFWHSEHHFHMMGFGIFFVDSSYAHDNFIDDSISFRKISNLCVFPLQNTFFVVFLGAQSASSGVVWLDDVSFPIINSESC